MNWKYINRYAAILAIILLRYLPFKFELVLMLALGAFLLFSAIHKLRNKADFSEGMLEVIGAIMAVAVFAVMILIRFNKSEIYIEFGLIVGFILIGSIPVISIITKKNELNNKELRSMKLKGITLLIILNILGYLVLTS